MRTSQRVRRAERSPGVARLRIGEVARLSGVGVEALRFYEKGGLLDSPARTEGGYRLYDETALERLDFIRRAQVLGFSLEEIRRVIADSRAGQSPCAAVREIVRRRLVELDGRMREMKSYRDELAATLAGWDERGEAKGHVCGLIESAEVGRRPVAPGELKRGKRR